MQAQSFQWENGEWHSVAGVPLDDRGFRHGMSAFETIAIRGGHLIFLAEHLAKLRHTCAQLGLREPPSEAAFRIELPLSATARIYVTAGDGSFHARLDQGRILLLIEEINPGLALESPSTPAALIISPTTHPSFFPGLKTGNYWPNIAAYRQAPEVLADEIVLVNSANHVISTSLANLFAVIDGLLFTPRVSSGARAGVLRDWVIDHEDVIVSDFHPEQLRNASEIFLSNSAYGIAPIHTLENKPLASQQIGLKLRQEYLQTLEIQKPIRAAGMDHPTQGLIR